MKTKNIFKALALAILIPSMLLSTACNSDITNDEDTAAKGYTLPVTVNVSRQGDDPATKATYNASTRKLEFSAGDKLFVNGTHTTAGQFAGTLTWTSGGTFSGTITTENEWTGTADALFTAATKINAYLLPAGYESIGFLKIIPWTSAEYDDVISTVYSNAFALTLAAGIEQLSLESAYAYSSGFALTPVNAILNFTISGLTASTEVAVVFSDSDDTVDKKVTTDASGNAKFVVGVLGTGAYTDIQNCTLTVGGKSIALASGSKTLEKGKIYNITRSALTYPIALSAVTSSYVGSVVTTDGNVYATVAAASAASKTAVAVIAYVGTAGSVDASSATYKGLAVALSDANSGSNCKWADGFANCSSQTDAIATALGFKNGITCTSTLTEASHSSHGHAAATAAASNNSTAAPTGTSGWFMPSMGQWNLIVQGLATKKAGSAVTTDLEENTGNDTYKADNLNSVITDAGGTGFQKDCYWASTEETTVRAWAIDFWGGYAIGYTKNNTNHYVRSIIAF